MYDFAQIFRRLYGAEVTDSPEVQAAIKEAERRYDAAGIIAERLVAVECKSLPGDELPRPSEAPTKEQMLERLHARLRA